MILFFKAIEIFPNTSEYFDSLMLAELLYNPQFCLLIIFAGIALITCGYYVLNNCSGTIGCAEWDEVINAEIIPQSLLIATIRAAIGEIFETFKPIVNRESVRQIPFSGGATVVCQTTLFRVFAFILTIVFSNFIYVVLFPFVFYLSNSFSVFFVPSFNTAFVLFWMVFVPFLYLDLGACFAKRSKAIFRFLIYIEEFNCQREQVLATRAQLTRRFHSVSLSLYLKWVSADGEIDHRFGSYPSRQNKYSAGAQ